MILSGGAVFVDAQVEKLSLLIVDYFVKLKGGRLEAGDDAAELRWVKFSKVENYDLTRSFREFFQRDRQELEKLNSCP